MNFRLMLKVLAVCFVSVLLAIPVGQVESLVHEREGVRDEVVADIAKSAGYAQTITGPFLVVPYERVVRTWTEETRETARQMVETVVPGEFVLLPKDFDASGRVNIEERMRGIYKARLFHLGGDLKGAFQVDANFGIKEGLADYTFGTPYLTLGLSDIRGIGAGLQVRWGESELVFEPSTFPPGGSKGPALSSALGSGVHALIPSLVSASRTPQVIDFSIHLELQGTSELRVVPLGRSSRLALTSNWPHPSFIGDFLPKGRSMSAEGFDAVWEASFFSTNMESLVERCHASPGDPSCVELAGKTFAVSFVDPVDHYLKSERATKYAFLFVGLTFAMFFMFEVLRRSSVHPVQYGLVGLALAVFFLLLLSISEHWGFAVAYLISSAACVLLVSYYVVPIVGSAPKAAGFGATLSALYAMLYGILSSEDYALLTGSLVVFAVLGLVMGLTRRVNWARVGQAPEALSTAPTAS